MRDWLKDVYTGVIPEPEGRRYPTAAGFKVRSKSEQLLVALLMKHHVPFKYEQHMFIAGKDIFPDFMIMNPMTGKLYVWEHLGMMDVADYRNHQWKKLNDYARLGFYPGDNLILTYETKDSGFDEIMAEFIIRHYFE